MKIFKKIKLTTIVGLLAASTLVYFNVRHALNDYGVRDNEKLHPEVMAQAGTTNGSGSGSGSGGTITTTVGQAADKEYLGYKNKTDKTTVIQFGAALNAGTTSGGESGNVGITAAASASFKRSCTMYNTYCLYTGDNNDICYGSLNGGTVLCAPWEPK